MFLKISVNFAVNYIQHIRGSVSSGLRASFQKQGYLVAHVSRKNHLSSDMHSNFHLSHSSCPSTRRLNLARDL